MTAWPPITEPLLLQRLAMTNEQFAAYLLALTAALEPREYAAAHYERAIAYPWARPESSYLLEGGDIEPLAAMDDTRRRAALDRFVTAAGEGRRFPLLAYGSNGAPEALVAKFAHFPGADRDVLVLAGVLHDFDVGVAAQPAAYGALPATLFESPATAVRCAVVWVNANQFVQLTWSEISYRLGRLDGIRFVCDDEDIELDGMFAFVSRFGAFCPDGEPVALAAVPAENRTATAMSQADVLDAAARIALGPGAAGEDLVRELVTDLHAFAEHRRAPINAASRRFASDHWVPFLGATGP